MSLKWIQEERGRIFGGGGDAREFGGGKDFESSRISVEFADPWRIEVSPIITVGLWIFFVITNGFWIVFLSRIGEFDVLLKGFWIASILKIMDGCPLGRHHSLTSITSFKTNSWSVSISIAGMESRIESNVWKYLDYLIVGNIRFCLLKDDPRFRYWICLSINLNKSSLIQVVGKTSRSSAENYSFYDDDLLQYLVKRSWYLFTFVQLAAMLSVETEHLNKRHLNCHVHTGW